MNRQTNMGEAAVYASCPVRKSLLWDFAEYREVPEKSLPGISMVLSGSSRNKKLEPVQ
ncbi:MAG: hypothetical protein LUQ25_01315 [Methanoregulaceae archaeon]|nr:hypothetical protein [Methanoregulaceae archaeon]